MDTVRSQGKNSVHKYVTRTAHSLWGREGLTGHIVAQGILLTGTQEI